MVGLPGEIRIGTRGSTLALAQTEEVRTALVDRYSQFSFLIQVIKTLGDRKQGTPLAAVGDKKDWVLECEEALVAGSIDIAVHSGKDVPVDIHPETELLPVLARATPFDAIRSRVPRGEGADAQEAVRLLDSLPARAVVATASLRRKSQIIRYRPDLQVLPIRGNVPTRIRKFLHEPEFDAIVLASAGLERLALESAGFAPIPAEVMVPAVNQGILLVQFCSARSDIRELLEPLVDPTTHAASRVERICIQVLKADCHSAVGVFATVKHKTMSLHARVLSPDGSESLEDIQEAHLEDAEALGTEVATKLLERGAAQLLHACCV